jgi:hypothetical protein
MSLTKKSNRRKFEWHNYYLFLFTIIPFNFFSQSIRNNDSSIVQYDDRLIVYNDFGFSSAPFNIHSDFNGSTERISYNHNFRLQYGIGLSYEWLALRISLPMPVYAKSMSRFGKNNSWSLGANFTFKEVQFELESNYFKGFSIIDAYKWNDSLNVFRPNDIRPLTSLFYFSCESWIFGDKNYQLKLLKGLSGNYESRIFTWFLNNSLRFNQLKNNEAIIPKELINDSISVTRAVRFGIQELGAVPGLAYVERFGNFQISLISGIGLAIQAKQYYIPSIKRNFIGLAPRYEMGINFGYSVPSYFIYLTSDIENISMRIDDLKYNQLYYSLKLTAGIRLKLNNQVKPIQNSIFSKNKSVNNF